MKRKILYSLVALVALYAAYTIGWNVSNNATSAVTPVAAVETLPLPNTYDLWVMTNKARQNAGLSPLRLAPKLNVSASNKCADMVSKNYWGHNDPSGRTPWHFITDAGYRYYHAGENIAYGYLSSQPLFDGWMQSKVHRDDILNANYADVGFGICHSPNFANDGPEYIVVQHFASPR